MKLISSLMFCICLLFMLGNSIYKDNYNDPLDEDDKEYICKIFNKNLLDRKYCEKHFNTTKIFKEINLKIKGNNHG